VISGLRGLSSQVGVLVLEHSTCSFHEAISTPSREVRRPSCAGSAARASDRPDTDAISTPATRPQEREQEGEHGKEEQEDKAKERDVEHGDEDRRGEDEEEGEDMKDGEQMKVGIEGKTTNRDGENEEEKRPVPQGSAASLARRWPIAVIIVADLS
jgi:hypothetical protein